MPILFVMAVQPLFPRRNWVHDGETLCFSLFCHCGMDILCEDVLVGFEEGSFFEGAAHGEKGEN